MNYHIVRTDTADAGIRKIILYIAQNFGNDVALQKLDEMEQNLLSLGDNPYIGTSPRYPILKRQGYKVLILEKSLVFYKINEPAKEVVISSFSVLYGVNNISSPEGMATLSGALGAIGFGPLNAYALMVFCLLYTPCVATLATIRKETHSTSWTLKMVVFQLLLAYVAAVLVFQIGSLF